MNVTIDQDELCPCGSNKKFKRCCGPLGHSYAKHESKFGSFVFDSTIADRLFEDIFVYCTNLNVELVSYEEFYNAIMKMTDKLIDFFGNYSACKMGCTNCCDFIVDITPVEFSYIHKYIRNDLGNGSKDEIKQKIAVLRDTHRAILSDGYSKKEQIFVDYRIPCIFLNSEGACKIYPARPIVCRTHMAFSPPEYCVDDIETIRIEGFEIIKTAIIDVLLKYSAKMFADKPTFNAIPYWFKYCDF